MSRIIDSFIEGYGSLVRLLVPPHQDDAENLKRDWVQVGNYLRHAIKEIEKEVQIKGGKPTPETGRERT